MTQQFLIRLPWPPTKSSPNGSQGDHMGKARAGRGYKNDCAMECMAQQVRRMDVQEVAVEVVFHPPSARAFDLDNMLARTKRGLDAVADAIGVDDANWSEMALRRGEKIKGGAVLVTVRGTA